MNAINFFRHKDVQLFLVLIPIIKIIDLLMTYASVTFDRWFFVAFVMNVFQGYACLIPIRMIIKRIEKNQEGKPFSRWALAKQLLFTFLATVVICIFIPDGGWLITGTKFTGAGNPLVHDLVVLFIWIVLVNF